jgi:DUF1680 family protein
MKFFPLEAVDLLDGVQRRAQDTDLRYLLALDPDRLLAPVLREAGLGPKAPAYPNWESTGLDGHILGHYLSAAALMVASTQDAELRRRLEYVVHEVARAQQAGDDGYVGGIPDGRSLWRQVAAGEVDAADFSLDDRWVPWYNLHKLFAGLIDAHRHAAVDQALEVVLRLSDWWHGIAQGLDAAQFENMLTTEFGGMNEVFADLAALTGRPEDAAMARRFAHQSLLQPLAAGEDRLDGMHANTQIPKVIGYARTAQVTGDQTFLEAARFFWETVVQERTVAIGGHGTREHFHPRTDFSSQVQEREGPESCNSANMIDLSRILFEIEPDRRYLDYAEKAQLNHVLSAQHPDGGFVYFTPLRPAHYRVYSQASEGFWCCVGSGLEAQARYGDLIWAQDGDALVVSLFTPSTLSWTERGARLTLRTDFPFSDAAVLEFGLAAPQQFPVRLRVPEWLASEPEWTVNGEPVPVSVRPDGYAEIERTWSDGDRLQMLLPMAIHEEPLPDGSAWSAIEYGPVVLAARNGTEDLDGRLADDSRMGHIPHGPLRPMADTPVLLRDEKVELLDPKRLEFAVRSVQGETIHLEPFFGIHDSRYTVYWPIARVGQVAQRHDELVAMDTAALSIDERTVDHVTRGEPLPVPHHPFAGSHTTIGMLEGRRWRTGRGWFGYTMRDDGGEAVTLRVGLHTATDARSCVIELDGVEVARVVGRLGPLFTEVEFPLPARDEEGTVESHRLVVRAVGNLPTPDITELRLMR